MFSTGGSRRRGTIDANLLKKGVMTLTNQLNADIARRLKETALILEEQGANPFRVQAYRHAAETVQRLDRPVAEILHQEGMAGLQKLPAVGESIARAIRDLVRTGRLPMLQRLRGEVDPLALLRSVPGIGPALARRLHEDLGIDTLEALEAAAHDGRLQDVAGVGEKKLAGIIDSLASRLGRARERGNTPTVTPFHEPPVAELLEVDREYRDKTEGGRLPKIAPRRFNPRHEAWLPVLHTQRGDRHYTALFSNTARAHQLGKTRDWIILYYEDGSREHQCTVITAQWGPLKGRRIVRGREAECTDYYRIANQPKSPASPTRAAG